MNATSFNAAIAKCRVAAGACRVAAGACLFGALIATPAFAATTNLKATYSISFGVTIGRVNVDARFTERGYAAAITGSTYGIVRLVSDANASLNGSGRLSSRTVLPNSYSLDTNEGGFRTRVRMGMRDGSVAEVRAAPQPMQASDRVPLTEGHKQNVVDPVGAFLAVVDKPGGAEACNRTVRVFDGWQRYDVRLSYKETQKKTGAYEGEVYVCTARYVPVAGYRASLESVQYMATNKRLEVTLAPIKGTKVLVPYRILIGTKYGDLVISATSFAVGGQQQAKAD